MNSILNLIIPTVFVIFLVIAIYSVIGWKKIKDCYMMWLDREYWKDYNVIEAASWLTKAIIIVPGLIFGIQIWWFYILTLITSIGLIWASNEKLLPTLVGFNTLWVWLSCVAIYQHFF